MKTYRTMVRAVFEVRIEAESQQEASRICNGIILHGASQVEVTELQHGLIVDQVRSTGPVRCHHGTVDLVREARPDRIPRSEETYETLQDNLGESPDF